MHPETKTYKKPKSKRQKLLTILRNKNAYNNNAYMFQFRSAKSNSDDIDKFSFNVLDRYIT